MSWLLPTVIPSFRGRARTIGEPDSSVLKSARTARWARSAKGRAYLKEWESRPDVRQRRSERKKRWLQSEVGKAWLERNRQRRNAYHMLRYQTDGGKRRAYLTQKQREYRARRRAAA